MAIGLADASMSISLPTRALLRQRQLTGTFGGSIVPRRDIPAFVELYAAGKLDLDVLVDRRYRLDEIARAFADLEAGEVTRGAIRF